MKKLFLLGFFLSFFMCGQAQNVKNDGKPYAFFCQIVGEENFAGKLRIKILWDNKKQENNIRDKEGNKIEFTTMVDAMNYMSKRGWEYVDSAFFSAGNSKVIHYVFKKMVTKDEEAKEGLYFKEDFKDK